MKKFLSLIMVLTLVFALGITVLADDTGSITITNATIGKTYTIYKIFDASIAVDANGDTSAVSYSITNANQFFEELFGADGTQANPYFVYNATTGAVTKKEGVNDSDLIKYLTELIDPSTHAPEDTPAIAQSDVVSFSGIDYGYYLITSSLGATVTINSNTPDVQVIDKNQIPGNNFDKLIQNGVDGNGDPIWDTSNTANIGDEVVYKISFEATNYAGENKILYYQIHDEKGSSIWAEFNSFSVSIDGVDLPRGYYLSQGGDNTENWEFLGNWSAIPEAERDRNDAQWYLVHLDEDRFRITIPWMTDHSLNDVTNDNGDVVSYTITYADGATFLFESPSTVEIIYEALIEANASIGNTSHGNRYNKAFASWTSENETDSTPPEEVVTYVYGIGLLKDDSVTKNNLAGAKFRIYKDAECTIPVYIIPTDVEGVYIVDSLSAAINNASGANRDTTRRTYAAYLAEYLGTNAQDNYAVTPVNGKIAILGLEAGKYYLREVEAPSGYNALNTTIEIVAGEGARAFSIFADENGKVADLQIEDATHTEHRYDITHTVVHNSKGVVLPSTGGTGTAWLIGIGTLIAIGFAVFLITHKKMSVYTD